jgi:hypothetical protein
MLQAHPFPPHYVPAVSRPAIAHDRLSTAHPCSTPGDTLSTEYEKLALYINGWSEADAAKIADATVDEYDFHDPLAGNFSKRTLAQYFALLRSRFANSGLLRESHLGFILRGPFLPCSEIRQRYWREAPCLGLTGTTEITVTRHGVAAEVVAHDLSFACEALRGHQAHSALTRRAACGRSPHD